MPNATAPDHPQHVWHQRPDGTVRCGHQGCLAAPSPAEAERVVKEAAHAAAMRITLDYRRGHA